MKKGIIILHVALAVTILAGCHSIPEVGRYYGQQGKLGKPELAVRSDGTLSYRYGPMVQTGTWVPISNMLIKAEVQGMAKHSSTRYYALDAAKRSFSWSYNVNDLEKNDGPDTVSESLCQPADGLPKTTM